MHIWQVLSSPRRVCLCIILDKVYWRFEIQNEKIIVQLKKLLLEEGINRRKEDSYHPCVFSRVQEFNCDSKCVQVFKSVFKCVLKYVQVFKSVWNSVI